VRYILDRIIGRHRSQPDVHIPALCRRTVTTVIRAQLHDFADPPYGFCMFTTPLRALRFARAAPFYLCAPLDGCHSYTPLLLWFARQLSKPNQNPHAARLRCLMMLDRYRSLSAATLVVGSASSGAAAARIKMLGTDRLNSDPRRQRSPWRGGREVVAEDVVVVDWGNPTKPPKFWGDRRLQ
jgi:hypothetical protein